MPFKMTAWGVGPRIALILFPYYALVVFLHIEMPGVFVFSHTPRTIFPIIGIVLIVFGLGLWASGAIQIDKAFAEGRLLTHGPYALVRHPMYSGLILFAAPGVALCFRSWLLLTPSIVAYVVFRLLIKKEDEYLEKKFGEKYRIYKSKTNAIIPFIRIIQ